MRSRLVHNGTKEIGEPELEVEESQAEGEEPGTIKAQSPVKPTQGIDLVQVLEISIGDDDQYNSKD